LRNFDSTYVVPNGSGFWKAPAKGQIPSDLPLHPHWGGNRTFAPDNFTLPIPEMLPFGYLSDSPYYLNMKEVYDKGKSLTQQEKEMANWWGDDPGFSYSPPGHSYNLATLAILKKKADLFTAAEAYAKVGMGVSDAFVNCWKCKYHYHVERPANFIFYNITTLWELYWPEPPFPAFYSGHATQAAATAAALTDVFGDNFEFTDNTNTFIPKDELHGVEYKARYFKSFWQAAEETALSRFYGGIHTRFDNEVGLAEGKKIGKNIINLFLN
jgi:PAP2 superfamily